ncbi:MAG: transposase, partial [Mycobacterium sp.]|nr:transposase [Mycobacterium sp.]
MGPGPVRALFEVLAGPLAAPRTPGVRFGRYQTVAFDGCVSTKVPDTAANRSWLGKLNAARGVTGYPVVELMTLAETGTRALLGAVFGPPATGETDYARRLLHLLDDTMLVLCDRGFDAGEFLTEVADTGAALPTRLCATRRLPVLTRLRDGSYLSTIAATSKTLTVRIITAEVTVICADGTRYTATYRLATTLCDARRYPAATLIALYHQRWEHEIAYLALRHTLCQHRVLRSGDPDGLQQEMWGLLALYQALRIAMLEAIESVPGTDPDRASFTTALETAQDQLVTAANIIPDDVDLIGDIGRAVLNDLLPPRRPRTSVRKV